MKKRGLTPNELQTLARVNAINAIEDAEHFLDKYGERHVHDGFDDMCDFVDGISTNLAGRFTSYVARRLNPEQPPVVRENSGRGRSRLPNLKTIVRWGIIAGITYLGAPAASNGLRVVEKYTEETNPGVATTVGTAADLLEGYRVYVDRFTGNTYED